MAYLGNSPLNALFNINPTTLTQGQTTVNVNYTPGRCLFYKNGALLDNGIDYTATNGSTVTMLKSVSQGDVLQCINLSSFNVANAMPLSGGQMSGPLTGPASATELIAGILPIATTALAQGWTDDASVITPKKLADAFKGSNYNLGTRGYQKYPSGLILQYGIEAINTAAAAFTFPIAFPTACLAMSLGMASVSPGKIYVYSITKNGFNFSSDIAAVSNHYWWAIGI